MLKAVQFAKLVPKNKEYRVLFNGVEADVVQASNACFASVVSDEFLVVEVICDFELKADKVSVGPASLGINSVVDKNTIRFTMKKQGNVVVWAKSKHQKNPLFIFTNLPEEKPANAMVFEGGQIHEVGLLRVEDGTTVYLEEGAYVRGRIWSDGTKGVTLAGRGVLDGSYFKGIDANHTVRFNCCSDITIQDITIINPTTWMVVVGGSNNVHIHGIREIGEVVGSDGIDLVGTCNALVEGCFTYNNDDCIVVKAFNTKRDKNIRNWDKNVENILVRNCTYLNGPAGNAIEIGHELRTDFVKNVVFENIDILSVHGHGAAFSIHAGDRAEVSNIIFRNIRVEHAYDKVFDIRVMKSQFNRDEERGSIKDILFENIDIAYSNANWGYTVSIISGYDQEHRVENVKFKDVRLNGEKVLNPDVFEIGFRHADHVSFE